MKITDSGGRLSHLHMRRFNHAHNVRKARNDANSRPTLRCGVHGIYLAAPLHAQARPQVQTWLSPRLQPDLMGALHGHAVEVLACAQRSRRQAGHPLHHYTTVYKVFAKWSDDGSLEDAFIASVRHLADHHQLDLRILHGDGTNTVAKKGGDGIGYSGHKHQKGEKVIAMIDNHGSVLAPLQWRRSMKRIPYCSLRVSKRSSGWPG